MPEVVLQRVEGQRTSGVAAMRSWRKPSDCLYSSRKMNISQQEQVPLPAVVAVPVEVPVQGTNKQLINRDFVLGRYAMQFSGNFHLCFLYIIFFLCSNCYYLYSRMLSFYASGVGEKCCTGRCCGHRCCRRWGGSCWAQYSLAVPPARESEDHRKVQHFGYSVHTYQRSGQAGTNIIDCLIFWIYLHIICNPVIVYCLLPIFASF